MVLEYGKVCYDDKGVANIFSLTNLVNKYRLTYNSYKYDDFTAHANIGIIKFRRNRQGIYAHMYYRKLQCCYNSGEKYGGIQN